MINLCKYTKGLYSNNNKYGYMITCDSKTFIINIAIAVYSFNYNYRIVMIVNFSLS